MVKVYEKLEDAFDDIGKVFNNRGKKKKEAPATSNQVADAYKERAKDYAKLAKDYGLKEILPDVQNSIAKELSAASVKEQLTILLEEYVDANLMLKAKQRIVNNKILKNSSENDVISLLLDDCDARVVRLFLTKQMVNRTDKNNKLEAQLEDLKEYVTENNDVINVCRGFLEGMTGDAKELVDTLESKIDFITAHIGKAKL